MANATANTTAAMAGTGADRAALMLAEQDRQLRRRRWLLLSPALLAIIVFGICPLLIIVAYSFLSPDDYAGVKWEFSTDAYVQFLFERDIFDETVRVFTTDYLEIYGRSFLLAVYSTVAALLFGFPAAYFMATRPPETRNLWVFLFTLPFWTNLLIRTYSMLIIIRDEGLVNIVLQNLGIIDKPLVILYTDYAVGLGLLYSYLPFMVLPIYASLEKLDFRLVEAGYDLYASRLRVLLRIIIPLAKPGIIAGCILVFIPALGAFITPIMLGGGKNLMIGNLISLQFGSSRNWPFGSAAALILMAFVMIALLFYVRTTTRARMHAHG
jgi:spermidine/putrescine transport system permease protein